MRKITILWLLGLVSLAWTAIGQTNPTPQTLPFSENFDSFTGSTTTYPNGFQGWNVPGSLSTSLIVAAPNGNANLTANGTAANNSAGIYDAVGKPVIQSTGSNIRSLALGINTTGFYNITITYDAFVVRNEGVRVNEFILQYRVGTTGDFSNIQQSAYSNPTSPIQTASSITGAIGISKRTFVLPCAVDNNSEVQLRWITRDVSGSGGRPGFGIDNLTISGSSTPSVCLPTYRIINRDLLFTENNIVTTVGISIESPSSSNMTLTIASSNYSSATKGVNEDYDFPTEITIPGNATSFNMPLSILGDNIKESDEYFILRIAGVSTGNVDMGASKAMVIIKDNDTPTFASTKTGELYLTRLTSFNTGAAGASSAEIVAYDALNRKLFVANSVLSTLDILDFKNPSTPTIKNRIFLESSSVTGALGGFKGGINSVAVYGNLVALALENVENKQAAGKVAFLNAETEQFINHVNVGSLPDMLTFNEDGTKLLTANEGEPSQDYTVDPEGSVSIITIPATVAGATLQVMNVTFGGYNNQLATLTTSGIRIYGGLVGSPSTVAQDLEPEYITIDGNMAYVVMQENNALAKINIATGSIEALVPLDFKYHGGDQAGLDASDNSSSALTFTNWKNLYGMYQPDAIAHANIGGSTFIFSANEGDARVYPAENAIPGVSEGAIFNEESRVSTLNLDPNAFPDADIIKNNIYLGRLTVSNRIGDTDGDGDIDELYVLGARSFSIWNDNGQLIWDSGEDFERITSEFLPTNFFNASNGTGNPSRKNRSDNKGPEPEGITVAKIGNDYYAFISLERVGGVMVYNVSNPNAPQFVDYVNSRTTLTGTDLGPEGLVYIPAHKSPTGKSILITANEISSTLTIYEVEPSVAPSPAYTLQMLHASDFEAGLSAIQNAPNFAAIVDKLEDEEPNTLIVSGGDNFIPSPFSNAGSDAGMQNAYRNVNQKFYNEFYGDGTNANQLTARIGGADINILNIIGVHASAVGNHEFDFGTSTFADMIRLANNTANTQFQWMGTKFPYLSANLDFSADENIRNLYTEQILPAANLDKSLTELRPFASLSGANTFKKIAPATVVTIGGEVIGIVGATTQIVTAISSTGEVIVKGGSVNNMDVLASQLQPVINSLTGMGINKIVLLSHLQQITFEKELIKKLKGVDIVVAAGSHTLQANPDEMLFPGDVAVEGYPYYTNDAEGTNAVLVSTTSEYKYVGRLLAGFDAMGHIVLPDISTLSGVYATTPEGLANVYTNTADGFALDTKGALVQELVSTLAGIISVQEANIIGKTNVYIEGVREKVRTEETTLGNITSDANLWWVKQQNPRVKVSLKNGGGVRAPIGVVSVVGNNPPVFLPPLANVETGKAQGDISQLDIMNTLRFNNNLAVMTVTAAQLSEVFNHAVAASGPAKTPGQFPQVSGVRFSFDLSKPVGSRVKTLAIVDENGNVEDVIIDNFTVTGNPNRTTEMVTLGFLTTGGDSYPMQRFTVAGVNAKTNYGLSSGATFATVGNEQDAFAQYLRAFYSTTGTAFNVSETPASQDLRIQNLAARTEMILPSFSMPIATFSGLINQVVSFSTISISGVKLAAPIQIVVPANVSVNGVSMATVSGMGGIVSISALLPATAGSSTTVLTLTSASLTKTFTHLVVANVPMVVPSITFTGSTLTVGGAGLDLSTVLLSNSSGTKSFSINGSAASLSGNNLVPVSAGTVTVTGFVASTTGFLAASQTAVFNIVSNGGGVVCPAVFILPTDVVITVGGIYLLNESLTGFTLSNPTLASVSGNVLTALAEGTLTVTVTVPSVCFPEETVNVTIVGKGALSVSEFESNTLYVYPNPVTGNVLYLSSSVNGSIVNAMGVEVKRLEKVAELNVADLPKGLYFLKAGDAKIKFVIE